MDKNRYRELFDLNFVMFKNIGDRACEIHESVNQWYDDKPYSYHLNMVVRFICEYGYDVVENETDIKVLVFGGYFHDSIEDARLTYNDVKKIALEYFGDNDATTATEIVYALTNEKGRNRHERANDKYYEGIRNTKFASFVKLCDRAANMKYSLDTKSRMFECYKKELPEFLEKIKSDNQSETLIKKLKEIV